MTKNEHGCIIVAASSVLLLLKFNRTLKSSICKKKKRKKQTNRNAMPFPGSRCTWQQNPKEQSYVLQDLRN
jgi:hypothetical protein